MFFGWKEMTVMPQRPTQIQRRREGVLLLLGRDNLHTWKSQTRRRQKVGDDICFFVRKRQLGHAKDQHKQEGEDEKMFFAVGKR